MTSVVRVLQPSGILDGSSANDLSAEVVNYIQSGAKVVLLDFEDVTFMNSSGIGALVSALKVTKKSGGNLYICSPNFQIRDILRITKLDKLFTVFTTREDFEQAISAAAVS